MPNSREQTKHSKKLPAKPTQRTESCEEKEERGENFGRTVVIEKALRTTEWFTSYSYQSSSFLDVGLRFLTNLRAKTIKNTAPVVSFLGLLEILTSDRPIGAQLLTVSAQNSPLRPSQPATPHVLSSFLGVCSPFCFVTSLSLPLSLPSSSRIVPGGF